MKYRREIMLILFSLLVGAMAHNQYSYEDCKKFEFKPKACIISEKIHKVSQK